LFTFPDTGKLPGEILVLLVPFTDGCVSLDTSLLLITLLTEPNFGSDGFVLGALGGGLRGFGSKTGFGGIFSGFPF